MNESDITPGPDLVVDPCWRLRRFSWWRSLTFWAVATALMWLVWGLAWGWADMWPRLWGFALILGALVVFVSYVFPEIMRRLSPPRSAALLLEDLASTDRKRRVGAAQAVAMGIGPGTASVTEKFLPTLQVALADEEWQVRSCASFALGQLGAAAGAALPALRELAEGDSKRRVRRNARRAVRTISA